MPRWLCDHAQAIQFCQDLLLIASRWDDLIDQDKPPVDAHINELLQTALSLPLNAFYIQHFAFLHPLLQNAIRNWQVATALERCLERTQQDLMIAFILRSSYVDIIAQCAHLLAGPAHALKVAQEARHYIHLEGFQAYCHSLTEEEEHRHALWHR